MTAYAEVIGDPIAHSKSPLIHNFWLRKLGLDHDYRRSHVTADQLPAYLATRRSDANWRGCNITIPHKMAVLSHVDARLPVVDVLGAANCITRTSHDSSRLVADNTDWSGFLEPIRSWADRKASCKFAHVIGTGGAAAAISYALDTAGFTVVSVARDREKALALRQRLGLSNNDRVSSLAEWGGSERKGGKTDWGDRRERIDMLVNTTPLGMNGYPDLDIDLDVFPADLLVYDIVYSPIETGLLRAARQRGMPTVDGLEMLVGQAARAFELFFAEKAPRQFDDALRALLLA